MDIFESFQMPPFSCMREFGEIVFCMEDKMLNGKTISDWEVEILGLILEGKRSKEISEKLFISISTNNHRKYLISKLGVSNSSEAVKSAVKLGII